MNEEKTMQSATRSDDRGTYDVFRPQILRLIERGDFTQAAALLGDLARALPVDPVLLQDLAHCHWQLGDQYNALQLIGAAAKSGRRFSAASSAWRDNSIWPAP